MPNNIAFLLTIFIPFVSYSQDLSFDSDKWKIDAQGHVIESHQGFQSLYLKGGRAILQDLDLENFALEFDIYLQERRSFSGVMFRIADSENYEEIYFRGHLSGKPDAMQYTPVFNGNSSWQLYHSQARPIFDGQIGWEMDGEHGYNNLYHYNFDGWTHAKLVVNGTQAELYLDENLVLKIADLKHGLSSGSIGFKSGQGGVHFANVSYREVEANMEEVADPSTGTNIVKKWSVSSEFSDSLISGTTLAPDQINNLIWEDAEVEANGLLNISRLRKRGRVANTVLARTIIQVDDSEIRTFSFGYSDKVSVFLNGRKLYSGDNAYRSRDYRFLGTIGLFDQIYLPLEQGVNTLTLAVSEVFGGWGIIGTYPQD